MNYIGIPESIILDSSLKPVDKAVWLFLAYCDGNTPSYRKAAAQLGIALETYVQALTRLLEYGLVVKQESVLKISTAVLKISTSVPEISTEIAKEKESSPLTIPYKEKENINNNIYTSSSTIINAQAREEEEKIERFRQEISSSQIKQEQYCKLLGLDRPQFLRVAGEVLDEWETNEDYTDVTWKHLTNHMRVKLREQNRDARTRQERRADWRAQLAAQAQAAINNLQTKN